MSKIQLRGHCPICGREHAVVQGKMSKHGYQVKNGWFQGICYGDRHEPMQKSRVATEQMVLQVRSDCAALRQRVKGLRDGTVKPMYVTLNVRNPETHKYEDKQIPFDEAPSYEQRDQIKKDAWHAELRANQGERFADDMMRLLDQVHGTPLREVDLDAAKPVPIKLGETRIGAEGTRRMTVTYIDGARIRWTDDRGFKGSTGSAAWRRFPLES